MGNQRERFARSAVSMSEDEMRNMSDKALDMLYNIRKEDFAGSFEALGDRAGQGRSADKALDRLHDERDKSREADEQKAKQAKKRG